MTDPITAITMVMNGALIGVIIFDWTNKRRIEKDMLDARAEYTEGATKLQELHNGVSQKIMDIEEKVAAHDYQLTARVSPKPPKWGESFGGNKRTAKPDT